MCKSVKSVLAALCGVTALAALPAEVLAGPMSAASPTSVGLTRSFEPAYYRGHRRGYYRHGYYRRGYGIPGAAVGAAAGVAGAAAGAAAGLLGAGVAGASAGYGYPGYGYGGSSCWQWDPIAGWVWACQ
ncbi:hypothetical protein [Methylocystis silviterrae]|uniref:hypothetical protein n=1 Tax=Methylocystis silviterrae TaxID=2743612 RepID=UPI001E4FC181|nr:hypothetical protein [Methylocystis silviterrae]